MDINVLRRGDHVIRIPGPYNIRGVDQRTKFREYDWPGEFATGHVQEIFSGVPVVQWDLLTSRMTARRLQIDADCLEFNTDVRLNQSRFQIGEEVRMISAYTYQSILHPTNHPGVGSKGTIIGDAYEVLAETGRAVSVRWHHIETYWENRTFHKVLPPDHPQANDFQAYMIDEICLQPVIPSDREIRRALESIERAMLGLGPSPAPIDKEIMDLFTTGGTDV